MRGLSSGFSMGPMARSRPTAYTLAARLLPKAQAERLRAEAQRICDAQPAGIADADGPMMASRIQARAVARELSVHIDDDDWPPGLVVGNQIVTDCFVRGVHLEPLAFDETTTAPAPPSSRGSVIAGPFLARVTDATMRRQPSWVVVRHDRGAPKVLLQVWSAGTGDSLTIHGVAPTPDF